MRGKQPSQSTFILAIDIQAKIKPNHPIRKIKPMADEIRSSMNDLFEKMYSTRAVIKGKTVADSVFYPIGETSLRQTGN